MFISIYSADEVSLIAFQSFLTLKIRISTHFHMKEEGERIFERIKTFGIQKFDENTWKVKLKFLELIFRNTLFHYISIQLVELEYPGYRG